MPDNDKKLNEQQSYADFYKTEELFFYFDPEKGYMAKPGTHPESDRPFIVQSWENFAKRQEIARQNYYDGKASPLLYHMERMTMELSALTSMVGYPRWKVKRHFKPRVYKKLKRSVLERYASVFRITVEELDKI